MNYYVYEGPVLIFGKPVTEKWEGETYAPSEKKARSNLMYQYKKQTNRIVGTKITLPGKIMAI